MSLPRRRASQPGHRVVAGLDDPPFTLQLHQNQIAGRQIDVDFSL
jgi:hypothetical protein